MAKSTKKSSKAKAAKPKAAKSKTTKPGAAKSKTAKPKAAKPKTTKPKAAKSKAAKPKAAKPKAAKPKAAKPKAAKSKAAKPSAAKSKTAKPSALKKKKVAASSPRAAKAASSREERKGGAATPAKRKLGLRGAAPWAARHAAKHAAEARARAAEPAPPGSARATIRVPSGAEEIKAKIAELHNQTQKIRTLRKRLDKGFFEIGQVLGEIQQQELFQAKGYGSFEAFLERETDLGKQTALKMIKISQVFQHDAAMDYGMDRLIMAINALEGDTTTVIAKPSAPSSQGMKPPPLPLKPPIRTVI